MVKQGVSRTLYFVLGLIAIVAVSKCNVAEYSWQRYPSIMMQKRQIYTQEISYDELSSFIHLWPEFSQLGLRDEMKIYGVDELKNKQINWKIRFWFLYHHWDIGRFFYVYERVHYVLHALEVHRNAKKVMDIVADIKSEAAKETINVQQERITANPITFSEGLLISSREKELQQLFEQYP